MDDYGLFNKQTRQRSPLQHIHHSIEIINHISKITTIQSYTNTTNSPIELIYEFPQTSTSIIYSITAEITLHQHTKILTGKIFPKSTAEDIYDDSIASGHTSILAQQSRIKKNLISLYIGNIEPDTNVKIFLKMIEELEIEWNEDEMIYGKLNIPIMGEKSQKKIMSIDLFINNEYGSHVKSVKCLSHEMIKDGDNGKMKTKNDVGLEKEVVIEVKICEMELFEMVCEKKKNGLYANMISILPNFKEDEIEEIYTEILLLCDCSGSMSGSRMKLTCEAIQLLLKSLDEDSKIKFNLIKFGSTCQPVFKSSVDFNKDNLEKAFDICKNMKANLGGTNITDVLKFCYSHPQIEGHSKQIILLTDGEADNSKKCLELVKKNKDQARIYGFGIGNGINPKFVEDVSKMSQGRAVFISESKNIKISVIQQLYHILQPSIHSVDIKFDLKDVRKTAEKFPTVFNKRRFTSYYFTEKIPQKVEVKYSLGEVNKSIEIKPVCFENSKVEIGVLAAKRRTSYLDDKISKEKDKSDDYKKEIVSLGIDYNIITSGTSLIMTAENENKITESMVVQKITPVVAYEGKDDKKTSSTRRSGIQGIQRGIIKPKTKPQQQQQQGQQQSSLGASLLDKLFGKKPSKKNIMRKNKRSIDKLIRDVEREKRKMEVSEKKVVREIKETAKKGDMNSSRILAKDLSRTRENAQQLYKLKAQLQASSMKMPTVDVSKQGQIMRGVERSLRVVNSKINNKGMSVITKNFSKDTGRFDMKEEIMNDYIDDVMEADEEEEEDKVDQILNSIMDEVGMSLDSQLSPVGCKTSESLQMEDDLSDRLRRLMGGSTKPKPVSTPPVDCKPFIPSPSIIKKISIPVSVRKEKEEDRKMVRKIVENFDSSSFTERNMSLLLIEVQINGIWKFSDMICNLICIQKKEIQESCPKDEDLDYWITAMIVKLLECKFSEKKIEWRLIVKKSKKNLKKKNPKLIELANDVLLKMKKI